MLGAWVFPSFLSVMPRKTVNFHGADYHMFDKDIFYESTLPGAGGVAVPLISPLQGLPGENVSTASHDSYNPALVKYCATTFAFGADICFPIESRYWFCKRKREYTYL